MIRQFYCNIGLADIMTPVMSTPSIEWRDEDSSGTVAAGWSKDDDSKMLTSRTPTGPLNQWGAISESSWGNKLQVRGIYYIINIVGKFHESHQLAKSFLTYKYTCRTD